MDGDFTNIFLWRKSAHPHPRRLPRHFSLLDSIFLFPLPRLLPRNHAFRQRHVPGDAEGIGGRPFRVAPPIPIRLFGLFLRRVLENRFDDCLPCETIHAHTESNAGVQTRRLYMRCVIKNALPENGISFGRIAFCVFQRLRRFPQMRREGFQSEPVSPLFRLMPQTTGTQPSFKARLAWPKGFLVFT